MGIPGAILLYVVAPAVGAWAALGSAWLRRSVRGGTGRGGAAPVSVWLHAAPVVVARAALVVVAPVGYAVGFAGQVHGSAAAG